MVHYTMWTNFYGNNSGIRYYSPVVQTRLERKYPNSNFMRPTWGPWGRQDPGGPHVGPMNFAIWVILTEINSFTAATQIAKFMGQHGAHLGPTGPKWAPCWPHELCFLDSFDINQFIYSRVWSRRPKGTFGGGWDNTGISEDGKYIVNTPRDLRRVAI